MKFYLDQQKTPASPLSSPGDHQSEETSNNRSAQFIVAQYIFLVKDERDVLHITNIIIESQTIDISGSHTTPLIVVEMHSKAIL